MITSGVITANLIAIFFLYKYKLDGNDFLILEAYVLLGAFIGAKLLYIITVISTIEWNRIFELEYFNILMQGGYVFYGGLIGGLLFMLLASRIHCINYRDYICHFTALIPLVHSFGRIGCFLAGCCYGMPYQGIGAVMFPDNSFGLSGVLVFPVQLLEAMGLLILATILFIINNSNFHSFKIVSVYFIGYGTMRFGLEFIRYDARGHFLMLSTSQWISIFFIAMGFFLILKEKGSKQAN